MVRARRDHHIRCGQYVRAAGDLKAAVDRRDSFDLDGGPDRQREVTRVGLEVIGGLVFGGIRG